MNTCKTEEWQKVERDSNVPFFHFHWKTYERIVYGKEREREVFSQRRWRRGREREKKEEEKIHRNPCVFLCCLWVQRRFFFSLFFGTILFTLHPPSPSPSSSLSSSSSFYFSFLLLLLFLFLSISHFSPSQISLLLIHLLPTAGIIPGTEKLWMLHWISCCFGFRMTEQHTGSRVREKGRERDERVIERIDTSLSLSLSVIPLLSARASDTRAPHLLSSCPGLDPENFLLLCLCCCTHLNLSGFYNHSVFGREFLFTYLPCSTLLPFSLLFRSLSHSFYSYKSDEVQKRTFSLLYLYPLFPTFLSLTVQWSESGWWIRDSLERLKWLLLTSNWDDHRSSSGALTLFSSFFLSLYFSSFMDYQLAN